MENPCVYCHVSQRGRCKSQSEADKCADFKSRKEILDEIQSEKKPMTEPTLTIDDLVVGSFTDARDVLFDVWGGEDYEMLPHYTKVLGALRMMNIDAINQLARPILVRMYDAVQADPKSGEGRAKAVPYTDNMALAIQDAVNVMMGQMQQRQQAQSALASGRGGLLKG